MKTIFYPLLDDEGNLQQLLNRPAGLTLIRFFRLARELIHKPRYVAGQAPLVYDKIIMRRAK